MRLLRPRCWTRERGRGREQRRAQGSAGLCPAHTLKTEAEKQRRPLQGARHLVPGHVTRPTSGARAPRTSAAPRSHTSGLAAGEFGDAKPSTSAARCWTRRTGPREAVPHPPPVLDSATPGNFPRLLKSQCHCVLFAAQCHLVAEITPGRQSGTGSPDHGCRVVPGGRRSMTAQRRTPLSDTCFVLRRPSISYASAEFSPLV